MVLSEFQVWVWGFKIASGFKVLGMRSLQLFLLREFAVKRVPGLCVWGFNVLRLGFGGLSDQQGSGDFGDTSTFSRVE